MAIPVFGGISSVLLSPPTTCGVGGVDARGRSSGEGARSDTPAVRAAIHMSISFTESHLRKGVLDMGVRKLIPLLNGEPPSTPPRTDATDDIDDTDSVFGDVFTTPDVPSGKKVKTGTGAVRATHAHGPPCVCKLLVDGGDRAGGALCNCNP